MSSAFVFDTVAIKIDSTIVNHWMSSVLLYRTVKLEGGCSSDALTKMVSTYALFFICPFLALTDTHLFLHQSSHIVRISCQFAVCLGSWCGDQDRTGS